MNESGNVLLSFDLPIPDGLFEATRTLYIGNFEALRPVPLPPAWRGKLDSRNTTRTGHSRRVGFTCS